MAVLAIFLASSPVLSGQIVRGQATSATAFKDSSADAKSTVRLRATAAIARLPLDFERNEGQAPADVKFTSRLGAVSVSFLPDRMEFATRGAAATMLSLRLVGAKPSATMAATEPLPGRSNFVIGNDPRAWRLGVRQFQRLRYSDVYDGIDVSYYGNRDHLEHDFVVGPGANPANIVIEVGGADKVTISPDGDAQLQTAQGTVSLRRPVVYQEIAGERHTIPGSYVLRQGNLLTFDIGPYDHAQPLIIDPVILFDDVLGGNALTQANGVTVDLSGNIIVTGYTQATNFHVVNATQGTCSAGCGNSDAFLTKLDPTGAITLYSTYFGGSGIDQGLSVTTDQIGNAYITGTTTSSDFPTKNAFQSSAVDAPNGTVFVAKFDPNGVLIYSTYLGGSNYEDFSDNYDGAIAVDTFGSAYVVGSTGSTDFPLKNAYQSTLLGSVNAFLTKFSPSGSSLVFSTYLGGKSIDGAFGVAVDSTGAAYVTGTTSSTNFPTTTGALSTTCAACANFSSEAFVTKFKPDGSGLVYSTFLGDAGGSAATGIAIDSNLDAYVSGNTTSKTFPVKGTLQQTCVSCADNQNSGFISELNPAGSALVYSNFIGGHGQTYANGIALDSSGTAYVAGSTDAPDFPTTPLPPQALGGLGIDSSPDSGTTIIKNNQGLASAQINAIVADSSNPGTVYAATLNGVFKSLDSGVTWTAMNSGLPAGPNGKPVANVQSIAVQPSSGKVLAGVLSKGVYASVNGGTSWAASNTGFPSPFSGSVGAIAFDPSNPTTVYVGIGNGITLLKSVNSGANWTRSDTGLPAGDNFFVSKGIVVDPRNSNNVFFSATEQFGTSKGLFASTNGAATWSAINTGLPTLTINSIAMDPASSSTLYAGTGTSFSPDGGVFKTIDSGAHWTLSLDAGSYQTNSLAVDLVTERVYAGLSGYGMVYSTDAGASWNSSSIAFANVSAIAIEQGATPTQLFGLSPIQGTIAGSTSFLTNFSADGSSLVLSTYSGGPYYNQAYSVAVDGPVIAGAKVATSALGAIGQAIADTQNRIDAGVTSIATEPVTNLSVTKTVKETSGVIKGNFLTYTITVKNNGPVPAVNPEAVDTLPSITNSDSVDILGTSGSVSYFEGELECYPPGPSDETLNEPTILAVGASFTCEFTVTTDAVGTAINTVRASANNAAPVFAYATTTVTPPLATPPTTGVPIISPTGFSISNLAIGATVPVTAQITNVDLNNILYITSVTPPSLTNASVTIAGNTCNKLSGIAPQQGTCTLSLWATGDAAGTGSGNLTIVSNSSGGNLLFPFVTNVRGFDTGIAIANTSVNSFTANTYAGGNVLSLNIFNAGPGPAIDPVVNLSVIGGIITSVSGAHGCTGFDTSVVECSALNLPNQGSAKILATFTPIGQLSGTATASVATLQSSDPDLSNNTATTTFNTTGGAVQTVYAVYSNSLVGNVTRGFSFGIPVGPPGVASGVVFDNPGNLYVAEPGAVVKYNNLGNLQTTIPIPGTGSGNYILGIAEDGDGKLYLPETNGNVAVVNSNGLVVSPLLSVGINSPVGGAVDSSGAVWFVGGDDKVTKVFGGGAPDESWFSQGDFSGGFGRRR